MLNLSIRELAIIIPVILASLTVHELAHAVASLALGDDTAQLAGRVSLNPIRHVDPVGFLLLVVAGFGWAKPVRFDRAKLRHPVRDEILVAFAGPASNLLLAFVGVIVIRLVLFSPGMGTSSASELLLDIAITFSSINIALALFNALPIPPLDGSHLYLSVLTDRNPELAAKLTKYGFVVLLILIFAGRFTGIDVLPIGRLVRTVLSAMLSLVGVR